MIQAYFNQIKSLVDRFSRAPFVVDSVLNVETRPGDQGYVVGQILFADESCLHFREFVDGAEGVVEKVMYTYHYQDGENNLIFRYDNALHRPRLASQEHKHVNSGIELHPAPALTDVLLEAAAYQERLL